MKIITDLRNINNLDELLEVDEIIIPTEYSILRECVLNIDEINKVISWCIYQGKKASLRVDRIIEESQVNSLYNFLDMFKDYDVNFVFSDLCVLAYFKEKNMLHKLVYNASTYMTNYSDLNYYKDLGIRVFMSNELSLDDVKLNSLANNAILLVYGYFPIYYSKRRVLELFNKHMNDKYLLEDNKNYLLKEELREEKYNLIEYSTHSVITSAKKMLIFEELSEVNSTYIYISSYKNDNLKEVISIFKKASLTNCFSEEDLNELKGYAKEFYSSLLYSNPSIL